jgi:hypothetical protein
MCNVYWQIIHSSIHSFKHLQVAEIQPSKFKNKYIFFYIPNTFPIHKALFIGLIFLNNSS